MLYFEIEKQISVEYGLTGNKIAHQDYSFKQYIVDFSYFIAVIYIPVLCFGKSHV